MTELELVKLSRAAGRDVKAVSKLIRENAARGSDVAAVDDPLVETLRDLCLLLTSHARLTELLEICPSVVERLALDNAPTTSPLERLAARLMELFRLALHDEHDRSVLRTMLSRDLVKLRQLLSHGEEAWIARHLV
jgi:hypothetical protein